MTDVNIHGLDETQIEALITQFGGKEVNGVYNVETDDEDVIEFLTVCVAGTAFVDDKMEKYEA